MNELVSLSAAYHFAATQHVQQRRKGDAAEPYMNHLTEVAELVAEATGGGDADLIVAAVLHDTVEDTEVSLEELAIRFGARVAGLVAEVTDDKSLAKEERKRLQIEHATHASVGAKIIKLADKTSNLRSLASSPPSDWPLERRRAYLEWAREVVRGCRAASSDLASKFDEAAGELEAIWSR